VKMADTFPGDPGIAAALLLNPVTLQPGEALFVPAGRAHAHIGTDENGFSLGQGL